MSAGLAYAVPPTPNSSLSGLASLALDSNLCVRVKVRRCPKSVVGKSCWLSKGQRVKLERRSDVLLLDCFVGHVGTDAGEILWCDVY